jgi:uncharacterized protein
MLIFEWDESKARLNYRKHGVSFEESRRVFDDPQGLEFYDPDHSSVIEKRFARIGFSGARLLFVVFAELGEDVVRIIHARRANLQMEKLYAQNK